VIYIEFCPYCLFVSNSQVIGCEYRLRNDLYCVGWGVKLYSLNPMLISKVMMPSLKWCVFIFYTVVRSPAAVVTATFFSSEVYTSKRWSVSIFNSSAHPSTSGLVSCRTRTSSMATVYQDINIIRSKLWCVDTVCSVTSTYAMLFSAVRIFKILD